MVRPTKLRKSPIAEALLDIRVNLPKETDLTKLASFQEKIKDRFPIRQTREEWKTSVQFKKEQQPKILKPMGGPLGCLFLSSDKKKVVQARLDGFTFNKLEPYEGWDKFITEARELWEHYIDIAVPLNVIRVALRYINRIEIPLPFDDFKDYILSTPEVAPGIPQGLDSFFMRLVIPEPETDNVAIVIQTFEPPHKDRKLLPLIFDIDTYREVTMKPDPKKIWEILRNLKDYQNSIFFNSITEKTLELFK